MGKQGGFNLRLFSRADFNIELCFQQASLTLRRVVSPYRKIVAHLSKQILKRGTI